jgi:hypothetical protein
VNNPTPATIVAIGLAALGVGLLVSHQRTWRSQQDDPALSDEERAFLHRRYRRRMQTSGMLSLLGILIGVGDALLVIQKQQPIWPTLYWIGVLLLTGWVMLLAFGDLMSTAARAKAELARARQKQRELERQVVEFKNRLRGDASTDPDRDASE